MSLRASRWYVATASVLVLIPAMFQMTRNDAAAVDRSAAQASLAAPVDRPVVADDGVSELYALDGVLLYGRVTRDEKENAWLPSTTRRWMRVVNGLQLAARGVPADVVRGDVEPFSIGRDATGRVVVVFGRRLHDGTVRRWWLYDVAADTARRLRVRPRRASCVFDAIAVWRTRVAAVERCRELRSHVVLFEGARKTRLARDVGSTSPRLMLRKRSLALIVEFGPREQTLWRVLDRGRRCPKVITGTVEENGIWAGIGSRTLTWALAAYEFDGLRFSMFKVGDVDLSGRCASSPRPRVAARSLLPQDLIHGAYRNSGPTIDGRMLYYATDSEIRELQLSAHGVAR